MSTKEIILYLRQQLLEVRGENDQQTLFELLSTFKMLTKISFDNADKPLVALLVRFTDAARELYMGNPLSEPIPTEAEVRQATANIRLLPVSPAFTRPDLSLKATETTTIRQITDTELEQLETHYNQEAEIQNRLQWVLHHNWRDHSHIRDGSPRQMKAYTTVYDELMIFLKLKAHDPMWVGSFPVGIDSDESDIDIVCNPSSLRPFLRQVRSLYGDCDNFRLTWKAIERVPTVIARFTCGEFDLEIYGQPKPTANQAAVMFMLVAARLLAIGGEPAKARIQELKANGHSSAEALAIYFQIDTPAPYPTLVQFMKLDNDTLREQITIPE